MSEEESAVQKVKAFYSERPLKTYEKGSIIVFPNEEQLPPITYIENGLIGQYDITTDGNKAVVNIFKPGAFFPASSAVNRSFNSYYFEALTDVSVRQSSPELVDAFLRENPYVVYDLLQRLYKGVDGVLKRMFLLLGETANARVLYELFMYADRFGRKQPNGSIIVDVTANGLAQQTGLARETVSRELKKLKATGILIVGRGHITLIK